VFKKGTLGDLRDQVAALYLILYHSHHLLFSACQHELLMQSLNYFSQATSLRCGWVCNDSFIVISYSPPVKEFSKTVNIKILLKIWWQKIHSMVSRFFDLWHKWVCILWHLHSSRLHAP